MSCSHLIRYFTAFAACTFLSAAPAFGQTEVHVLDVGQGLSVLVESQGHYLLYDGGDRNKSSYVVSYLKEQGVRELDYMIASHYDSDHLNGLVGALNTVETDQVFCPDYTTDTRVFASFQNLIDQKGIPRQQPAVGSTYQLGDASFQILSPSGTDYGDENNYSIGIRIVDGDSSFLITGDAEAEAEAEICASGLPLESSVYIMGHHGSGTSTSWDLLQKAVPEYAILSCGTGNSYGHPHIESMEKLQAMEIPLFRTDRQGVIIASTDGTSIHWNQEPVNDYTPGDPDDQPAQPSGKNGTAGNTVSGNTAAEIGYVLNISSKKIHRPDCKSVAQMSAKNKQSTSESLDVLLGRGYSKCKNCNP